MLHVVVQEKTMGSKLLLKDFELRLAVGEKVGFLGRNGAGKSTLFAIITGQDTDYIGSVQMPKQHDIMSTNQEHLVDAGTTLEYVSKKLPRFVELEHIITTYPDTMGTNLKKIATYSDALEEFSSKRYYEIENSLQKLFAAYQLDDALLERSFLSLSGGQKRLIDLIALQLAEPHIILLDEPTNHMDYVAKEAFLSWLIEVKSAVLVISHDRDVLKTVDRIVELKDKKAYNYPGNYDAYLAQNAVSTTNAMNEYGTTEKRIKNLKEQIEFAKARAAKGGPRWVTLRERYERELNEILETREKPQFWIDRESQAQLQPKIAENYHKFKSKNIRLHDTKENESSQTLLRLHGVSLGYAGAPLFVGLSASLSSGERLHVVGRNGAGKTTLVQAVLHTWHGQQPSTLLRGAIETDVELRISVYEQEIGQELLELSLYDAIEAIYISKQLPVNDQQIKRDMGNYLFDVNADKDTLVAHLSGGQKARLQLIRLLVGSPNLLILDEPTNHLDLPSIEELENAIKDYAGAVIYITHDSYFAKNIGGKQLHL
jgi:ATP-binding cassette, subfamily F, member 3